VESTPTEPSPSAAAGEDNLSGADAYGSESNVAEASEVALEDNDKADAVSADEDLLPAANPERHAVVSFRLH
jgi:hypothetical protein